MVKFLVTIAMIILGLSSCSVSTSSKINVDVNDIMYIKDSRTGLCYAIVASEKATEASSSGLGITQVPCDKVEFLIK